MSSNVMLCLKIQNIVKTSKSSRCWHLRDLNKISFFDLLMRIDLNNSIDHQNSCPLIFCWSNTLLTTCRPYQKLTSLTYIQHPHYINDNIEPSCAQVTVSFQSLFFSDLMFYVPVVIRLIHLPSPPWRQHDPLTSSWMELNVLWYFLEILPSQSVMSLFAGCVFFIRSGDATRWNPEWGLVPWRTDSGRTCHQHASPHCHGSQR